jgi:hypothetical protein
MLFFSFFFSKDGVKEKKIVASIYKGKNASPKTLLYQKTKLIFEKNWKNGTNHEKKALFLLQKTGQSSYSQGKKERRMRW